jgi:hypothetical protein
MALPLLCRGTGLMDIKTILHQIKHAYDTFSTPTERDWKSISQESQKLKN